MIEDHEDELGNVELEQPSANEYREAAQRWIDFAKRSMIVVKAHKNPMLALDCWLLAVGWYDILGCDNQVSLATAHGVTKANISYLVKRIQATINLEPMPGQRTLAACKKFKQVRKAQLK